MTILVRNAWDKTIHFQASFGHCSKKGLCISNTFLTAIIYDLEPNDGLVIVSAETETAIGLDADTSPKKVVEEYESGDLERSKRRLSVSLY